MTALNEYSKWDRILAEELSSSDAEPNETKKVLNRLRNKGPSFGKDGKVSLDDENIKKRRKDLFSKNKKQKKKKKKKRVNKVYYDAMNVPRHGLRGIFNYNFHPTSRLINNSIPPGVACGNLIHFYYESNTWIFILLYIINTFTFFRITYFYDTNFIVLLYYFHLIRKLFHCIIDIPLCLFDCRLKNVNHKQLRHWRIIYQFYTFFMLLLCAFLFYILSSNGPKLGFKEYFHLMCFMKDDNAWNKIENTDSLWFGIIYVLILTIFVDIIYIGLLIYNVADFKHFKKENMALYLVRYASAMVKMLMIEVIFCFLIWIIKSENDPSLLDIFNGIATLSRTAILLPILTVLYLIATWITNKLQYCLSPKKQKKK